MKKAFFISAAISLAIFFAACQESMINEPVDVLQKSDIISVSPMTTSSTIKLNQDLQDPVSGTSRLTGRVTYNIEVMDESMSPVGLTQISLHLYINSKLDDLFGMSHMEWKAEGRSDDVFFLSEDGIKVLEKSYSITNRNDVVLLLQYLVTSEGVGISKISLAQIEKL